MANVAYWVRWLHATISLLLCHRLTSCGSFCFSTVHLDTFFQNYSGFYHFLTLGNGKDILAILWKSHGRYSAEKKPRINGISIRNRILSIVIYELKTVTFSNIEPRLNLGKMTKKRTMYRSVVLDFAWKKRARKPISPFRETKTDEPGFQLSWSRRTNHLFKSGGKSLTKRQRDFNF